MSPTPIVRSIYYVGGGEWYAVVRYGQRVLCMSIRGRAVRQLVPARPIGRAGFLLVRDAVRQARRVVSRDVPTDRGADDVVASFGD